MPTYDFQCTKCSLKFEHFKKINDPNPICPKCSSETNKLLTMPMLNIGTELVPGGTIVRKNF